MKFLVDHNIRGQAQLLWNAIEAEGWLDFVAIRFIAFEEIGLEINSDDRSVWQLAQAHQMILLTANRSMKGKDSLEQVMRENNMSDSLPVVTISNCDRINEAKYRSVPIDS